MNTHGYEGPASPLRDRLASLKDKAARLPADQQHLLSGIFDEFDHLLDDLPLDRAQQPEAPAASTHLLDEIPCMIWRAGLDGKLTFFNHTWLEFTGRAAEQEYGDGWTQGIHPEDVDRVALDYLNAFATRQPFEMQYRLRHHSGEYRWILDAGRPLRDERGRFTGYIGTCLDLTQQKQMESALEDSYSMFRGLFDFAPDALVAVDGRGRIVHVNQQVEQLFGYPPAELIDRPVEVLMPDAAMQRHQRHVEGYMQAPVARPMGRMLELMGRRKDGSLFPVDITLGPLRMGQELMVLAAVRDRSEHKAAEAAIRERDQFIQTALSTAPIIFFKIDAQGIVRYSVGPSPARQEGIEPVGKSIYELYSDVPPVVESYEHALAGEAITVTYQVNGRTYIGSYAPFYTDRQEIDGVVGVATDITAYQQVEDELRNSQARFDTIFDQVHMGMAVIDLKGRIFESNPAFEAMLDCATIELQQMPFIDLVHPADTAATRRALRRLLAGQEAHITLETRYQAGDDELIWGRTWMSLVRGDHDRPLYAICLVENITQQKLMSAELAEVQRRLIDSREAERLHLSQELHDGPLQDLQAINFALAELAQTGEREPIDRAQETLSEVIRSVRVICGELRPPALAPFGLEKAIRSYLNQIREKHPDLEVVDRLQEDGQLLPEHIRLGLFRILQHTLMNTVKHSQATQVEVQFSFDDDNIHLEIRDNGQGFRVPRRWVELVREGHFGLVGANERARAVGGSFNIESRPGAGTTVKVRVPRRETNNTEQQGPVSLLISS